MLPAIASTRSSVERAIDHDVATTPIPSLWSPATKPAPMPCDPRVTTATRCGFFMYQ